MPKKQKKIVNNYNKNKSNRHRMRELVFKSIFQIEFNDFDSIMFFLENESVDINLTKTNKLSAKRYFNTVVSNLKNIDEIIDKNLLNWDFSRLSIIDKSILRLATYELIYEDKIPIEVSIDEAIEIAKEYDSEKGGKFVNGVLDNIAKKHTSAAKKKL
ncbi:MAG: transcription antitermination protein NusB [Kosmotogales bacterium]|nr:transcription antitermination protein NusB [Kosmotogales bacterium]